MALLIKIDLDQLTSVMLAVEFYTTVKTMYTQP